MTIELSWILDRMNPFLKVTNLPELCSDLISALTSLNMNNFAHGICLFQKADKTLQFVACYVFFVSEKNDQSIDSRFRKVTLKIFFTTLNMLWICFETIPFCRFTLSFIFPTSYVEPPFGKGNI